MSTENREQLEREGLEAFQRFYDQLPVQRDVFYMFFTLGLLHWVERSLRLVPEDVTVVLLGSRLSAEERSWIPSHFRRPFHHIDVQSASDGSFSFRSFRTSVFPWNRSGPSRPSAGRSRAKASTETPCAAF